MTFSTCKFVVAMMDSEMFFVSKIDQPIVTSPTVGVDHTLQVGFPTNNGLQCGFSAIWDNFCIDFTVSLEHTENGCFAKGSTPSFPFDPLSTEIGFINFDFSLERRFQFTEMCNLFTDQMEISVDCIPVEMSQG